MNIFLENIESDLNKSTNVNTDQASNAKYPSVKAVFDWATNLFFPKPTGTTSEYLRGDGSVATFPTIPSTTADISDSTNKRYVTDAQLTVIGNTSGTNTGDETKSSILSKLGVFEAKLTSGNQTTTANTQVAITELKVTPTINKRYRVSAIIHLGCSNTAGVRVGLSIPTGASVFVTAFGTGIPSSTNSVMSFINASGQLFQNLFVLANSSNGMCIINGEIEIGATAGDVQLTFRSDVSGQTSTVFQLGTHLKLEEI